MFWDETVNRTLFNVYRNGKINYLQMGVWSQLAEQIPRDFLKYFRVGLNHWNVDDSKHNASFFKASARWVHKKMFQPSVSKTDRRHWLGVRLRDRCSDVYPKNHWCCWNPPKQYFHHTYKKVFLSRVVQFLTQSIQKQGQGMYNWHFIFAIKYIELKIYSIGVIFKTL